MAFLTFSEPDYQIHSRLSAISSRGLSVLAMIGFALALFAQFQDNLIIGFAALTGSAAVLLLVALIWTTKQILNWLAVRDRLQLDQLLGDSDTACFLTTSGAGRIVWCNPAARARLNADIGRLCADLLSDLHVDPREFVVRMQTQARTNNQTKQSFDLPNGERRYRVEAFAANTVLWRIDLPQQSDPRDTLPFKLLQFDAAGRLSYASPALKAELRDQNLRVDTLFPQQMPCPGTIVTLDAAVFGFAVRAVCFQPDEIDLCSLVLLPADQDSTADAPELTAAETRHLQNLPVGLAHIGADGRILYVNDEARRLLRLRGSSLPEISDVLEGLGRPVTEWVADIASRRLARAHEVLRLSGENSETYLKLTLSVARPGMSDTVVAVLSDVTEFKSLEAKFTQSQKMQAIGQLAGGVAHDFNNLLTAITGHCDLLLLRHDKYDPDYPDLIQIQQNSNRAAALVRQLLALSRKQSLQFVTLDLQETMEDVIHLLNRLVGEKITLSMRHGSNVAPIRSDKRQFEQILMNLVVNARDALPMGGEIRIETRSCSFPKGVVRDEVEMPPGDYTQINVSDDGTGIPQALLHKIFDPFFTTKRQGEGTGLGLSTVYGIVKQSGGYIFVDSEEGVGTTFSLFFTAQRPNAPKPRSVPKLPPRDATLPSAPQALILLVEDEAPVRSFAARALELQGYRVLTADSGEAALAILSNPEIRPDCFVTDVIMPGLDGPGWIREIQGRFKSTPVLFISGYAEDSHVAAQARIGNAAFLGKPFSLSEFTDAVAKQLQKRDELI